MNHLRNLSYLIIDNNNMSSKDKVLRNPYMGESTSERGAGVWHGPPSALSLSVAAAEACEHPHVGAELRVVLELVGHGGRYRGLLELPLVLRRAQAAARGFGFGSGFGFGFGTLGLVSGLEFGFGFGLPALTAGSGARRRSSARS